MSISKFGVISFHHGDNRTNRGGPSGFWEVLNGEPSSGFIIQKLNSELDGGEVLLRGNMMTSTLWRQNNAQLLNKSNVFMMNILHKIAMTNSLPNEEGVRLHGNRLNKLNSNFKLINYLLKVIFPKIFELIIAKLLSQKITRWSIAYSYHNNFSKSLWRYKEIENPKGRFLADPFVIEECGETFIFAEDFSYKENKGKISVIKIDRENYEFIGVALEEKFHLSFPFIFKEGNDIYMIPESSKNSDIRLYKSIQFPLKWKFEKQLMINVDAADTMVIRKDNLWFMLTNICSAKIRDHNSELHIFYSEDFKNDQWIPIQSGNPVIFDPLKGRNGGFFTRDDKLYRINQKHGQGHYGKNFCVNEILVLSKDQYLEKEVSIIEPNFKKSTFSTHHFSATTKIAAVDFARIERLKNAIKETEN